MAATRNINIANCALNDLNCLIENETGLDGALDSSEDIVNLRAAQVLVTSYIAATATEVGTDEDIAAQEQQEEDDLANSLMNAAIRMAAGYC
jgi:hypothetical protein